MIIVTGITGQLGFDVAKELKKRGLEFIATTKKEIDLSTEEGAKDFILKKKPESVIHCAAYTAVDNCRSLQRSRRKNDLYQHGLCFWRGRSHALRND